MMPLRIRDAAVGLLLGWSFQTPGSGFSSESITVIGILQFDPALHGLVYLLF